MFDARQRSIGAGAIRVIFCGILGTAMLHAVDFSSYRGLQFGMDLAAATKQAPRLTEVRVVHQRPALLQELEWQPRPSIQGDAARTDPLKEGLLCFYNGQLFRIVVTYERYKIEGMTADDMIDGISATYGKASTPAVQIAYRSIYGETAAVLARWEDPEYSYDLIRTGDRSSFALVLYSKRLDALAQAATVEAVRLDVQEAPQRELDRQKKQNEDEQLVLCLLYTSRCV